MLSNTEDLRSSTRLNPRRLRIAAIQYNFFTINITGNANLLVVWGSQNNPERFSVTKSRHLQSSVAGGQENVSSGGTCRPPCGRSLEKLGDPVTFALMIPLWKILLMFLFKSSVYRPSDTCLLKVLFLI